MAGTLAAESRNGARWLVTGLLVLVAACDSTSGEGIPGDEGNVLYVTPAPIVFEERLLVGSTFEVTGTARREGDVEDVQSGSFVSSDESVLQVEELEADDGGIAARVTLVGPGEAELQVASGGEVLDRMRMRTARAAGVELFDPLLLYEDIDARLPESFGIMADQPTSFVVGAEDVCGGPLIVVGGISAAVTVPDGEPGEIVTEVDPITGAVILDPTITDDASSFEASITFTGTGFDDEISRALTIYPRSAVDEVEVAVASGDGQSYTVWGRAFVDDYEVIGLEYDWDASPRVSLSAPDGAVNFAEVSHAAEGEPADTRPTFITAEVFGESDTVDLETVQFATISRIDDVVPVEDDPPLSGIGSGCGDTETCDPYAAFAPFLLLLGRRLRRRRGGDAAVVSEASEQSRDPDDSGDDAPASSPDGAADRAPVLEVDGVTKYYRDFAAVRDVSFAIERGEVVGFLGPNGAGKSTTMRMLTGAIPATRGAGRVSGFDVFEQPLEVKRRVGYLPEIPPVYTDLTVRDQLKLGAALKGLKGETAKKSIQASIDRCQLHEHVDRLVGALSKGFRQRVGLAQALLGDPDVLVLDEPTVGLDPRQIQVVRDLIRELSGKHTIILSTHILQEVTALCTRVIIIRRGEIVLDEPIEGLSDRHGGLSLEEIFLAKVEDA